MISIGDYACSGLTGSLIIPNSVTYIGDYAFRDCSGFTGSLTSPNYEVFSNYGNTLIVSLGFCIYFGHFEGCSGLRRPLA